MLASALLSVLAAAPPAAAGGGGGITEPSPPSGVPNFSFDQLYHMADNFMHQFVYNTTAQAQSISSTLFASNAVGRIDVMRDVAGRELSTENLFGLFAQIPESAQAINVVGTLQSYEITHFVANQNIVSLSAVVECYAAALNSTAPVEMDFWLSFNAQGQITQWDATFRWLMWSFQTFFDTAMAQMGIADPVAFKAQFGQILAGSVCNITQDSCKGANAQYDSLDACVSYLSTRVPFGDAWQLGMDTLACRAFHQAMVPLRPATICPNMGPSGGNMCNNDRTYVGTVTQPLFRNQPFVPYGYASKNATVAAM